MGAGCSAVTPQHMEKNNTVVYQATFRSSKIIPERKHTEIRVITSGTSSSAKWAGRSEVRCILDASE